MSHGYEGIHMTNEEINHLENTFDSAENGYSVLSDKQKNVFKIALQQNLIKCGRCEEFLWEEASFIIDNGLCTYCQQVWDND